MIGWESKIDIGKMNRENCILDSYGELYHK